MSEPLVSIGVPVYNGEEFLRQALDGLTSQTYRNIEIIISDNASTDATQSISAEYARRDSRITYYRNETNLGAGRNFQKVLLPAKGKYFMWAAADDIYLPEFIETCVAKLEKNPSLVLCYSSLRFIDESGQVLAGVNYVLLDNPDLSHPDLHVRLTKWWSREGWYGIYALFRLDVLSRATLPAADVYGSDVVFMTQMLYHGAFGKVPRVLFFYRQFRKKTEAERYTNWQGEEKDGTANRAKRFLYCDLYISIFDVVARERGTPFEKGRLIAALCRAWKRRVAGDLRPFITECWRQREMSKCLKASLFYLQDVLGLPLAGYSKLKNMVLGGAGLIRQSLELPSALSRLSGRISEPGVGMEGGERKKRCAVIEYNWWHDVTLPTLVHLLNALGYEVDVFTTRANRRNNVLFYASGARFSWNCSEGSLFRRAEKKYGYRNHDLVIANTIEGSPDACERLRNVTVPCLAVVHNTRGAARPGPEAEFAQAGNRGMLALAAHVSKYLGELGDRASWFAPVYLGEVPARKDPSRIVFCVQGNVSFVRRNYNSLVYSVKRLLSGKHTRFAVQVVGRSDNEDGEELRSMIREEGLEQVFEFGKPGILYRDYYAAVKSAHFLLPLIDHSDVRYSSYYEDKASSSFMVAIGLSVVPIVEQDLADLYGLGDACITYRDGDLEGAMAKALAMDPASIQKREEALSRQRQKLLEDSAARLKELVDRISR